MEGRGTLVWVTKITPSCSSHAITISKQAQRPQRAAMVTAVMCVNCKTSALRARLCFLPMLPGQRVHSMGRANCLTASKKQWSCSNCIAAKNNIHDGSYRQSVTINLFILLLSRIHFYWLSSDFSRKKELFSMTNLFMHNTNVGFQLLAITLETSVVEQI